MTQITITRSQNIGFVLNRRVPAHRLAPEFDEWGLRAELRKSADLKKKGG